MIDALKQLQEWTIDPDHKDLLSKINAEMVYLRMNIDALEKLKSDHEKKIEELEQDKEALKKSIIVLAKKHRDLEEVKELKQELEHTKRRLYEANAIIFQSKKPDDTSESVF